MVAQLRELTKTTELYAVNEWIEQYVDHNSISCYQKMLVFVWRLLETLGYIEYKQEWDKESWSRSLGSLRSTLTLHAWMKMNMREKDSKRHSHSDPEGVPGLQGKRTSRRQGPNQVPPLPGTVLPRRTDSSDIKVSRWGDRLWDLEWGQGGSPVSYLSPLFLLWGHRGQEMRGLGQGLWCS